jgi:hypothetical protein
VYYIKRVSAYGLTFEVATQTLLSIYHCDQDAILRRLTPLLWNWCKIFFIFSPCRTKGVKNRIFENFFKSAYFLYEGVSRHVKLKFERIFWFCSQEVSNRPIFTLKFWIFSWISNYRSSKIRILLVTTSRL